MSSSTVLITGANRGLGLEFVKHYAEKNFHVLACHRDGADLQDLHQVPGKISKYALDIADKAQVNRFAEQLDSPIDILINNAGYYGEGSQHFGKLVGGEWDKVLHINVVAPILFTQTLLPLIKRGTQKKIVFLTSKMGSIGDNSSGGSYYYRSSKTALNSAITSLAIDLKSEGIAILPLHPGWVRTRMGGPNGLISPAESIVGMTQRIEALSLGNSGQFVDYKADSIPW